MLSSFSLLPAPIITTPRLELRVMTPEDSPSLYALRSDPVVMRFIPRPLAKTTSDTLALIQAFQALIEAHQAITWGIFLRSTEALIGTIGYVQIHPQHSRAEVGYLLGVPYQRNGFMSEALNAVLIHGFRVWKFHTVEAIISPDNLPSRYLLEKIGFIQEGYFKENQFYHGRFHDSVVLTHFGAHL
ncbi:MAG: GNAT family N-acetyltransferase [Bacteroidetes Order II. Incertae sedis bacterium]|nr:GNAT family N-acetyltransferase [Bacteroidetes Order II. bacterium]